MPRKAFGFCPCQQAKKQKPSEEEIVSHIPRSPRTGGQGLELEVLGLDFEAINRQYSLSILRLLQEVAQRSSALRTALRMHKRAPSPRACVLQFQRWLANRSILRCSMSQLETATAANTGQNPGNLDLKASDCWRRYLATTPTSMLPQVFGLQQ